MQTNRIPHATLSGRDLCRLMRRHGVTIRELSRRMGISQVRIRYRRRVGLSGVPMVLDWTEAITGEFTPRMRAMLNQWREARWPSDAPAEGVLP